MAKKAQLKNGSKTVYTSGVDNVTRASWNDKRKPVDANTYARFNQLASFQDPAPSQKYTFQRGLARAALKLPEQERVKALTEVLAAMDLLERFYRVKEEV